jgi:hypothetical protein
LVDGSEAQLANQFSMQHSLPKVWPAHGRASLVAAGAILAASTSLLAQGWQRVVNLNDLAGSAIGGGSGSTLYAGLAQGHLFRSAGNGLTWTGATNGLVDNAGRMLASKAFVITPTGRVIRGGDNASWNNKVGSPIFYPDNQGAIWTEVPLPFASPARNPARHHRSAHGRFRRPWGQLHLQRHRHPAEPVLRMVSRRYPAAECWGA